MAMFIAMRIDYEHYRDPRLVLGLGAVTLAALAAVLVIGPEINGTHRWFAVAGVGIQPSELAKIAIILFTAAVLERRMDRIDEPAYAVGPIVVALVPVLGLIMWQPDFGSSLVLLAIVAAMVFAAGLPWRYIVKAGVVIVPVVAVVAILDRYRVRRLTAFLDPVGGPAGLRLPAHAVADRRRHRGRDGDGARLQRAEAGSTCRSRTPTSSTRSSARNSAWSAPRCCWSCFALITWRGLRTASRAPDALRFARSPSASPR